MDWCIAKNDVSLKFSTPELTSFGLVTGGHPPTYPHKHAGRGLNAPHTGDLTDTRVNYP
jgi:Cu/Zn superoxide dismutase